MADKSVKAPVPVSAHFVAGDRKHILYALDLYMKSIRRSINTAGEGEISQAYERQLAVVAQVDSRARMMGE